MKITDWTIHTPDRHYHVFLEIHTDEGLSGWGACFSQTQLAVPALEWLKRFVMGENPLEIERLTEKLHQLTQWHGRGGALTHAISAINIALWDVSGKAHGQPVSVLLGGRHGDRVPAYASILFAPAETLPARIEKALAQGFRTLKFCWDPFGQQSLGEDEQLVATARRAAGDATEIMVDAGGGSIPYWQMRFKDALARARMLADYRVYWLEEPLTADDIDGYARLTELSPIKIAHGEVLTRRQSFVPYFRQHAMDIVQPDCAKVGGLSEARRIGWMAEEHGIELAPHGWNTGVGLAADIHLVASLPSRSFVEFAVDRVMVNGITTRPFQIGTDGCLEVPAAPGLGIDLDRERLKELEASRFAAPTWTREEEEHPLP